MRKTCIMFFVLLGAFGLMAGFAGTPAFAVDKSTNVTKVAKVDVNKATEQELQELPGIGAVYAKKVIDGRPYKSEADLIKAGIPQNVVDKIKDAIKYGKVKVAKPSTKIDSNKATTSKATKTNTDTDTSDETAKVPPHKGMVWVNKNTMVYHKEGDRWYGKTKNGEFMNEQDAIKLGARVSKQD
jgi:Helix-hairpin-helix motif